jgi:hypothetical protein
MCPSSLNEAMTCRMVMGNIIKGIAGDDLAHLIIMDKSNG